MFQNQSTNKVADLDWRRAEPARHCLAHHRGSRLRPRHQQQLEPGYYVRFPNGQVVRTSWSATSVSQAVMVPAAASAQLRTSGCGFLSYSSHGNTDGTTRSRSPTEEHPRHRQVDEAAAGRADRRGGAAAGVPGPVPVAGRAGAREHAMTLTWAADIEAKPYPRWQYMACPACAAETCPYGGFGSSPTWKNVGNSPATRHQRAAPGGTPIR